MSETLNPVETPWGPLRRGDSIVVSTSQRKAKKEWGYPISVSKNPLQHNGRFIGILEKRSRRTERHAVYPELDSYIEIKTDSGCRTQIPFSNIDSINKPIRL